MCLRISAKRSTRCRGGELRPKLAITMAKTGSIFVLDEPTTELLVLLDRLVDEGNAVIGIGNDWAVAPHADSIIDLEPGVDRDGGRVMFSGTPGRRRENRLYSHGPVSLASERSPKPALHA